MHNIITIIKKELARFFKDKKLFVSTVLFPGIMIYVLYSFMGSGFLSKESGKDDYIPKVVVSDMPPSIEQATRNLEFEQINLENQSIDDVLDKISNKEIDLAIIISKDFDASIENGTGIPSVELYYNSTKNDSARTYQLFSESLNQYENSLANVFDVNSNVQKKYDLASEKDMTALMFSSMLPMLLMIFIFSGCMGIAPESIAGEKERGTMATLLVTPMKRSELAIGKIVSLSILSLLSGLSSFIGTMLSMPKLYGSQAGSIGAASYSLSDYGILLVVIVSSILIIISLISIISAYSKSVKEASTAIMPLMIIVMLVGVSSMMIGEQGVPLITALIPLYNNVVCMTGIFGFNLDGVYLAITVISNVVYTLVFVYILARMFNSEKCMF